MFYKNEGYWTAKIQLDLFRILEMYMEENGLSRTQLARKLGVSKGYITQVLNGDFDHRLSKLVGLSLAVGKVPDITFRDLNEIITLAESSYRTVNLTDYKNQIGDIDEAAETMPIEDPKLEPKPMQHVG